MKIKLSDEDLREAMQLWVDDAFITHVLTSVKTKDGVVEIEVNANDKLPSSKKLAASVDIPADLGTVQRGGRAIGEQ